MNAFSSIVSTSCAFSTPRKSSLVAARTELRPELREELDALYRSYAAGLPHKIARLETMWQHLRCGEIEAATASIDEEISLPTFYRLVHNLAGSGALYGFSELSEAARELTRFLKPWSDPDLAANSQQPLKGELCERIETLLAALKATI